MSWAEILLIEGFLSEIFFSRPSARHPSHRSRQSSDRPQRKFRSAREPGPSSRSGRPSGRSATSFPSRWCAATRGVSVAPERRHSRILRARSRSRWRRVFLFLRPHLRVACNATRASCFFSFQSCPRQRFEFFAALESATHTTAGLLFEKPYLGSARWHCVL